MAESGGKGTADAERAFAFMQRGDIRGTRVGQWKFGTAVETPEVPLRHDSNYLTVEQNGSARAIAEAARAHPMGSRHRKLIVEDGDRGRALEAGLVELGWTVDRGVVMVERRPRERVADTSLVIEVDHEALRDTREREVLTYPWGSPELARQLFESTSMNPLQTRFFAVFVDGEPVSYTDLYVDPPDAQIEAVYTVPEHRGRGYASAVVARAADEARLASATFVFLVADADDWPQQLYRRLGFDEVGRYYGFLLR